MPEPDSPPAQSRIGTIANSVLIPGVALLMLNITLHAAVVSFTLRRNSGARTLLIGGALFLGFFLGGVFFPRLSSWGRRSGGVAWRVLAALWIAAAAFTALFGLHAYVFNEPLRVVANLFLGMAVTPVYQLFFARFPVRWRGTWFGVCLAAGVLCWELFLISQTDFRQPGSGPDAPFHPLLASVYQVHAVSLVILAMLFVYALITLPDALQDEKPHFAPLPGQYNGKALIHALMASTCLIFFIGGIIDVNLAPAFPSPPPVAFRIVLSILAVTAAPIAGWLLDKWPERIFGRIFPVCCALFILTPALATLDAAHALHAVLQPVALAAQIAFFTLCSVAAAGLAPDAGLAGRYACAVFALRILATVFANMLWHRVLGAGAGAAVFVVSLLALAAYRIGSGMGLMVENDEAGSDSAAETGPEAAAEAVPDAGGAERRAAAIEAFFAKGGLTPRERETAALLLDGRGNQDIAGALSISEWTVKKHTTNIYRKFNVASRFDFLRLFVDETDNSFYNKN